jgi:rare lipoprotein A
MPQPAPVTLPNAAHTGTAPDRAARRALALALAALLAACGTPGPAPRLGRDGPAPSTPPGLEQVPDAEPRVEPLRSGGPNKPYEVAGRRYAPAAHDISWSERGLASWYGAKFHGRPTASGEVYDMFAMTAAHRTLPIPSYARVRNPANGREVIVRINDRGPFVDGRVVDLSYTAALRLGVLGGVAPVELQRLTHEEIRAGLWRRERRTALAVPPPEPPAAPAQAADDDPLGAMLRDRGLAPPPEPLSGRR